MRAHFDLTSLSENDREQDVLSLLERALPIQGQPACAAICVFPNFLTTALEARERLGAQQKIKIAVVAGAFPHAQSPLEVREHEIQLARQQGADEIDIVFPKRLLWEKKHSALEDELAACRQAAGTCSLKIILETGAFQKLANPEEPEDREDHEGRDLLAQACHLALNAGGADFLKTSTGKIAEGATLEKSQVLLRAIKDHHQQTGEKKGFKAAGGIRTLAEAQKYAELHCNILGKDWLTPDLFRIGTSRELI